MTDRVEDFLRAERAALIAAAPPPHASRLWHARRARNAAAVQRAMRRAGWAARLATVALTLVTAVAWREQLYFLLLVLALVAWLTSAACAPIRRARTDFAFDEGQGEGI